MIRRVNEPRSIRPTTRLRECQLGDWGRPLQSYTWAHCQSCVRSHSGNGWSLVSGANAKATIPTRKKLHIEIAAQRKPC